MAPKGIFMYQHGRKKDLRRLCFFRILMIFHFFR